MKHDNETYHCLVYKTTLLRHMANDGVNSTSLDTWVQVTQEMCRMFYDTILIHLPQRNDKYSTLLINFIKYFYFKNNLYNPKFVSYAPILNETENINRTVEYMWRLIAVYNRCNENSKIIVQKRECDETLIYSLIEISKNKNPEYICSFTKNSCTGYTVAILMSYIMNSWGIRGKLTRDGKTDFCVFESV